MGGMLFNMRDVYPNLGTTETSTEVNPEVDDQNALNEDVKTAEESSTHHAKSKSIFLAIGVMVALVLFFGGGK